MIIKKKPIPGIVRRLEETAAGAGAAAVRIVHGLLYGSRSTKGHTAANTAPPARAAVGSGLHSVWQGPPSSYSGAPVLRRY